MTRRAGRLAPGGAGRAADENAGVPRSGDTGVAARDYRRARYHPRRAARTIGEIGGGARSAGA